MLVYGFYWCNLISTTNKIELIPNWNHVLSKWCLIFTSHTAMWNAAGFERHTHTHSLIHIAKSIDLDAFEWCALLSAKDISATNQNTDCWNVHIEHRWNCAHCLNANVNIQFTFSYTNFHCDFMIFSVWAILTIKVNKSIRNGKLSKIAVHYYCVTQFVSKEMLRLFEVMKHT